GRCVCFGNANSPRSEPSTDSAPHATGQCQHAYFFSIDSLTVGPFMLAIAISSTRSTTPTPPQFSTGASPLMAEFAVIPVVPNVVKNVFDAWLKPSSEDFTVMMTSLFWAMIFFVG